MLALAQETGARIVRAEPLDVPLRGYQRTNFEVAVAAAPPPSTAALQPAQVAEVAARVRVPGRLQVVAEDPLTILDGAHNPSGMAALAAALPDVVGRPRPLVAVVSVLDDKDAAGMLRALIGKCRAMVFTASRNPRALPPATLASLAEQLRRTVRPRWCAIRTRPCAGRRSSPGPDGAVLATGSIYLVADLVGEAAGRRASAL